MTAVASSTEGLKPLRRSIAKKSIGSGLINLGNTCFMNAILQCLLYSAPLVHYFGEQEKHTQECQIHNCSQCDLHKFFHAIHNEPRKTLTEEKIRQSLPLTNSKFKVGVQGDAHEYLISLVNALHESHLTFSVPQNGQSANETKSFFSECLQGKVSRVFTCSECGGVSEKKETISELSFSLHNGWHLDSFLKDYFAVEFLTGENKYFCSHCKVLVDATAQVQMRKCPPILTLQFQRFCPFREMKISKFVEYPSTLYLPLESSKIKYSLYAMVVHQGETSDSGHYYAFVKAGNNMWHHMNDSHVEVVPTKNALRQLPYLLFYMADSDVPHEALEFPGFKKLSPVDQKIASERIPEVVNTTEEEKRDAKNYNNFSTLVQQWITLYLSLMLETIGHLVIMTIYICISNVKNKTLLNFLCSGKIVEFQGIGAKLGASQVGRLLVAFGAMAPLEDSLPAETMTHKYNLLKRRENRDAKLEEGRNFKRIKV